jgi:hypothetical protein
MKTFILFFYLSFLSFLFVDAAGNDSLLLEANDSVKAKPVKKICTCELVKLTYDDYKKDYVALMAEKTSNRKIKLDYKIAAFELWKERKYLSTVFVSGVQLIEKINETGSCENLYKKLSVKHKGLKMYSIIDMDVRSIVMR